MKKLLFLFLLSATAFGQTWFTIPNAYNVNTPIAATFRYGTNATTYLISTGGHNVGDPAPAAWSPSVTVTGSFILSNEFPTDPSYGTSKELDILETSVPQTITNTPNDGGGSVAVTITVPAAPPSTNSCSSNNTSCTNATNSDAAHIVSPAGDVSLNPTETNTLKAAIQALQYAQRQVQAAQAALQTVQQTIAVNHGASATGPYEIDTDFSTTIDQVPPVPVTSTQ